MHHPRSNSFLSFLELFSVNRRNQLENYTVAWAKIISFVLFEINCISVAGA